MRCATMYASFHQKIYSKSTHGGFTLQTVYCHQAVQCKRMMVSVYENFLAYLSRQSIIHCSSPAREDLEEVHQGIQLREPSTPQ